jgi:hypothetical protein
MWTVRILLESRFPEPIVKKGMIIIELTNKDKDIIDAKEIIQSHISK